MTGTDVRTGRGSAARLFRHPAVGSARATALLLHGLGSGHQMWDPFLANRPDDLAVVTAELPWRGDGQDWGPRTDLPQVLADTLDAVGEPVDIVVAHSFAAVLMLELISSGVDLGVRGLVLVSPFYRPSPADFSWSEMPEHLTRFERTMADGIAISSRKRLDDGLRREMALLVCDRVGPYGWLRFFTSLLGTPALRTELVTMPCLVVTGALDTTAPPEEGTALAAALPDATDHRLPDCGHFAMVERPDLVAAAVNQFLTTLPGATRRAKHQVREGIHS